MCMHPALWSGTFALSTTVAATAHDTPSIKFSSIRRPWSLSRVQNQQQTDAGRLQPRLRNFEMDSQAEKS